MKVITDKPERITWTQKGRFFCMGVVQDSGKDYACLMDTSNGKQHIEEIIWSVGDKNIVTANLRWIKDDKEWNAVLDYVTAQTNIFSIDKIRDILSKFKVKDAPYIGMKI